MTATRPDSDDGSEDRTTGDAAGSTSRDEEVGADGRDTSEEDDGRGTSTDRILDAYRERGATIVTARPRVAGRDADDEPGETGGTSRGRRLYDWWSDRPWLYGAFVRLTASMRAETFDALSLEPGETVLDLACGPGTNFERLRDGVGSDGAVLGLDYSPGMTRRATELNDERGWENVHVVRVDAATTCGPEATFDAAVVTFALHTMAEARSVVENVHEALEPGGRFVVLDARPLTDGPATLCNPLYERAIARTVNHQRGLDTLPLLRGTFESVELVDTYDAGAGYLAVATKDDAG